MERACSALCKEADALSDVHLGVRERLINEIHSSLKRWSKETFHKDIIGRIKEKEEIQESFRKVGLATQKKMTKNVIVLSKQAQKPWVRRLKEVERTKKDYYSLCQKEASAMVRERNAQRDEAKSLDEVGAR